MMYSTRDVSSSCSPLCRLGRDLIKTLQAGDLDQPHLLDAATENDEELVMAGIEKVELRMVDLVPKVKRTDAIQSFVSQETPIVTITD